MTAADLTDLLTKSLTKMHGRSQRSWRAALGPIKVHDRRTHPHCNWSITPSGSAAEITAIEDLLDDVRLEHPMVAEE
jgi:hypothetical protein